MNKQPELALANAEELNKPLSDKAIKQLVEAAIFVAQKPLSLDEIRNTVLSTQQIGRQYLKELIGQIQKTYKPRGVNLVEVASGYRFQAASEFSPFLSLLWQEKAPKYSRAMLETLSLIAYRQPITRGEIEQVRGVAVSSHIVKSLQEREWIKVVGHKEVPGRPALLATTKKFLDYFGLKSLNQLPELETLEFTDDLAAQAVELPNIKSDSSEEELQNDTVGMTEQPEINDE